MAAVDEGNDWDDSRYKCHIAEGNPVEFAATSKCRFLDILQYPASRGTMKAKEIWTILLLRSGFQRYVQ